VKGKSVYRWDEAWKIFLNPEAPWCTEFIEALLPDPYKQYVPKLKKMTALETESHMLGRKKVADRFILFNADDEERVLHFEFQSTFAPDIAVRCIEYGLQKRKILTQDGCKEEYRLPDSFIVNVRAHKRESVSNRQLHLYANGMDMHVNYPVIEGHAMIPELGEIMQAKTVEEASAALNDLEDRLSDFSDSVVWSEQFHRACAIIMSPSAFEQEGADKVEVDKMTRDLTKKRMTGREAILAQAEERYVNRLMHNLGVSREKALELLREESTEPSDIAAATNTVKSNRVTGFHLT